MHLARYSIIESPDLKHKSRMLQQLQEAALSNIESSMQSESKLAEFVLIVQSYSVLFV